MKLITGLLAGWILAANVDAGEMRFESVGLRYGISSSNLSPPVHQALVFTDVNLPWRWRWSEWAFQTGIEASAGLVSRRGDNGFIGALGPRVVVGYKSFPVFLDAGGSFTALTRHELLNIDLGTWFEFTSYGGVFWDLGSRWRVGYRFQHMSNGGIASPNPGLNMHTVGVSWRF